VQLIVSLAWDWRSSVAVCAWIVSGVGMADHIKKSKKEAAQHISVSLGGGRKVVVCSGSQKIGSITMARCSTRTRSQLAKRGQASMCSLISCHVITLPQRRTGQLTVELIAFHSQMRKAAAHRVTSRAHRMEIAGRAMHLILTTREQGRRELCTWHTA
jgi:hypothetical protein